MMNILFILNILYFLFITIWKIRYLSNYFKLGLINPISITFIIDFPSTIMSKIIAPAFLVNESVFNPWYNFAIFMTNISLSISFLLMVFVLYIAKRSFYIRNRLQNIFGVISLDRKRMIFVSLFFLILFFIVFLLLTQSFGLFNWITNPRQGYQYHRVGNGHWFALSILFLTTSYTIALIYSKTLFQMLTLLVIYSFLVFFLGAKGPILSFFTFFLIMLWFRKSKYFIPSIIFLIPIIFIVLLINFNPNNIMHIVSYFNYYPNSAMYYEEYFKGSIDLFYGKIWLTDFYQYVPRALFPDKPFAYGILLVNEHFWPGLAATTHTPAFGESIKAFADFGVFGVILYSIFDIKLIINTLLLFLLYSNTNIHDIRKNSNRLYLFIWLLAPSFLNFFGTIYSIIIFILIIKIISISNRIKIQ